MLGLLLSEHNLEKYHQLMEHSLIRKYPFQEPSNRDNEVY